jgi:hypothetical protein
MEKNVFSWGIRSSHRFLSSYLETYTLDHQPCVLARINTARQQVSPIPFTSKAYSVKTLDTNQKDRQAGQMRARMIRAAPYPATFFGRTTPQPHSPRGSGSRALALSQCSQRALLPITIRLDESRHVWQGPLEHRTLR